MRSLSPCPSSPNCVSTQAQDAGHAIAPFRYRKPNRDAGCKHEEMTDKLVYN